MTELDPVMVHTRFLISTWQSNVLVSPPLQSDRQRVPVWRVCPCFPLSEGFPHEPCGEVLCMVTSLPAMGWTSSSLSPSTHTHTHTHKDTTCPTSHIIRAYRMIQSAYSQFLPKKDAGRNCISACFQLGKFLLSSIVCLIQYKAWVTWPFIMYIYIIWFYIFFYI